MKVLDAYPFVREAFNDVREEQSGQFVSCECTLKQHRTSRLRFWLGTDRRLMFGCFACGEAMKSEILRAVGLKWSNCFPEGTQIERVHQETTAKYHYRDEHGQLLYMTLRLEPGRNGRDKEFLQLKPNPAFDRARPVSRENKKWVRLGHVKELGRDPVLYRLPQLLRADRERPVFKVSGEKDADNLTNLGLVATTNVCGESAEWLQCYSDTLAGRHVVIIEDADETGRRHANEVLGSVMRVAKTVQVVRLPQKDATAFILATRRRLETASLWGATDPDALEEAVRDELRRECQRARLYRVGLSDEGWGWL